jgi:hypothetical protein
MDCWIFWWLVFVRVSESTRVDEVDERRGIISLLLEKDG